MESPASRSVSPFLVPRAEGRRLSSSPGRERISREEVQRRMMNHRQRNSASPAIDIATETGSPRPPLEAYRTTQLSPTDASKGNKDTGSILTMQTDCSTETAVVESEEERMARLASVTQQSTSEKEFGLLGPTPQLEMDFGSKFSLGGFGPSAVEMESKRVDLKNNPKVIDDKLMHKPAIFEHNNSGIKMGDVDVDMDMKSALDRLMEDVAGAGGAQADDSMTMEDYDESFDLSQSTMHEESPFTPARPKVLERAATDSAVLQQNIASGIESRTVSGASTITDPPPVPPKDDITMRERFIHQRQRQSRGVQEDDADVISRRAQDRQSLGYGRPSRRRSLSTGDAEVLGRGAQKRGEDLLNIVSEGDRDDPLADSIEKELQKLAEAPNYQKKSVRR